MHEGVVSEGKLGPCHRARHTPVPKATAADPVILPKPTAADPVMKPPAATYMGPSASFP